MELLHIIYLRKKIRQGGWPNPHNQYWGSRPFCSSRRISKCKGTIFYSNLWGFPRAGSFTQSGESGRIRHMLLKFDAKLQIFSFMYAWILQNAILARLATCFPLVMWRECCTFAVREWYSNRLQWGKVRFRYSSLDAVFIKRNLPRYTSVHHRMGSVNCRDSFYFFIWTVQEKPVDLCLKPGNAMLNFA